MKTAFIYLAACAAGLTLLSAEASSQNGQLTRTELVVISDLSNRIDRKLHPGAVSRDTAILRMISEEFADVVKRNRFLFSRDRARVLYVGGENPPTEPRIDVAEMNRTHHVVVRELPAKVAQFVDEASQPYRTPRTLYEGADLWSWFKHNGQPTLGEVDPDRQTRNRIVILTDGYLEFAPSIKREPGTAMRMSQLRGRPDWQRVYQQLKLKPPGFQLPKDTKVLMLELAPLRPTQNTTEQEIIERYWADWFASMGATVEFRTNAEAMPSIRDAIRRFLQ